MATIALLAATGCSTGDEEEPGRASGAPAEIATTVNRLERAIAAGDFELVCERLFSAGARRRAGGEECASQVRSSAEGVERPRIEIGAIEVNGERASVRVRTRAKGQARLPGELLLRREGGRWLVEALR